MRYKMLGKSFAVCNDHLPRAVEYMKDIPVKITAVTGHSNFRCFCSKKADWYIREMEDDRFVDQALPKPSEL